MFRDFNKYEVYSDGRIWSYSRNKFLKPQLDKDGYQRVWLTDNEGKAKRYAVHKVVWESVTSEPIPEGYEINHRSEDKTENFFENLELVTHKEKCNFGTRNRRIGKAQLGKHHTKERKENIRKGVLKHLGIDYEQRKKVIDYLNKIRLNSVTTFNQANA